MKRVKTLCLLVLVLGSVVSGCATRRRTGGSIGAGAGAVVGGVVGHQSGHTVIGAILGAAVGGAAGAFIGDYMDKQAAEIERDIQGAHVTRVGEGIKITFDSGLLFDVDKAGLRPEGRTSLGNLAGVLQKYPDTDILIEGHTDSDGTEEHNLELSRQRAQSAANQLARLSVDATRFTLMGYGEDQPVASNDTPYDKQKNRRVEIAIMANDKLKKAAK